jgi:hypothetical protein
MTFASVMAAKTPSIWCRLGESSGTTAADASGNGRDGTYSGGPDPRRAGALTGDANTAVTFDGSNDKVAFTYGSYMNTGAALSLFAIVKFTSGWHHLDLGPRLQRRRPCVAVPGQRRQARVRHHQRLLRRGGLAEPGHDQRQRLPQRRHDVRRLEHQALHRRRPGPDDRRVGHPEHHRRRRHVHRRQRKRLPQRLVRRHDRRARRLVRDGPQRGDFTALHSEIASPTAAGATINAEGESDATADGTVVVFASIDASGESDAVATPIPSITGTVIASGQSDATADGLHRHPHRTPQPGRRPTPPGRGVATWEPAVVPAPVPHRRGRGVRRRPGLRRRHDGRRAADVHPSAPTRPRGPGTGSSWARRDVTYFRDPDAAPDLPAGRAAALRRRDPAFPQIAPPLEQLGVGALSWLKPGKPVVVQRVLDDVVVATDYIGIVIGLDVSGATLTVQVGGEASGRAALMNRQLPIFNGTADIGRYAYGLVKDLGLPFTPHLGPTTGIALGKFGGMSMLDYANELCARGWTRDGNQWSIMPDAPEDGGRYRMPARTPPPSTPRSTSTTPAPSATCAATSPRSPTGSS